MTTFRDSFWDFVQPAVWLSLAICGASWMVWYLGKEIGLALIALALGGMVVAWINTLCFGQCAPDDDWEQLR